MEFKSAKDFSMAVRKSSSVARSIPEFLTWMDEVMHARRDLYRLDREEGHKLSKFRDPWKPFLEELVPLFHWLRSRSELRKDLIVKPTMRSIPPDATLSLTNGSLLNVEVVKKRDGWLEHLTLESVRRFGGAALTPKDGVAGVKAALAAGKMAAMEARDSEQTFANLLGDVQIGIEDKASKSKYWDLQPISLLAVADNTLSAGLERFAAAIRVPDRHPFCEIYLVSTNQPKSIKVFPKS